jgi:hypothetical protein
MDRIRISLVTALLGVTLAAAGVAAFDAPAFAMSGSSSTAAPPSCRAGWTWNKAKRICERTGSGLLDDEGVLERERRPV